MANNKIHQYETVILTTIALVTSSFSYGNWLDAPSLQSSRFIERKAEGWFWYDEEEIQAPKPEPPPASAPTAQTPEVSSPAPQEPIKNPGPSIFSAKWFRENLDKYQDAAWNNPTPENVRAFLYMQRFVMDRSEEFADAAELAVIGDPLLDEITRRPLAGFATQHMDSLAGSRQKSLLATIPQKAGLFFFFSGNCDMCEIQAPIVQMLQNSYDFAVVPISVDGQPLKNGLYQHYRTNEGHAEKMGVTALPATVLVGTDGTFASVSQGTVALNELAKRVLIASRRNNWISQDQYDSTRPMTNTNSLSTALDSLTTQIPVQQTEPGGKETNFVSPEQIIKFVREKANANQ